MATVCNYSTLRRGLPRWLRDDVWPKSVEVFEFLALFAAAMTLLGLIFEVVYLVGKITVEILSPHLVEVLMAAPHDTSRVSPADLNSLAWWFFDNPTGEDSLFVGAFGALILLTVGGVVATTRRICELGGETRA